MEYLSLIKNNFNEYVDEDALNFLAPLMQYVKAWGQDIEDCFYIEFYFPVGAIELSFDWEAIKNKYGIKKLTINYDRVPLYPYPINHFLDPIEYKLLGYAVELTFQLKNKLKRITNDYNRNDSC